MWTLILLACAGNKNADDTASIDNDGDGYTVADDCNDDDASVHPGADPTGAFLLQDGDWVMSIDEEDFNHCHNAVGNGLHIHTCENTDLEFTRTGGCVTAVVKNNPGEEDDITLTGWTDGNTLTVQGSSPPPFETGTCFLLIQVGLQATLQSENSMDYRVDTELLVEKEGGYVNGEFVEIPGSCDLMVGDTSDHTFPELPCDQAWTGRALFGAAPDPTGSCETGGPEEG